MDSAGTRLKKIRLEKGFTLGEAAKKTKIHSNVLKAIEEDSLVNLDPIYTKGFLKIYCKFLGVNPADFISDYREPRSHTEIRQDISCDKRPQDQPIRNIPFNLSAVRSYINPKVIFIALVVIFALIILSKIPRAVSSLREYLASKSKAAAVTPLPKSDKNAQAATVQKVAVATVVRLGIRVKENCLVKVKVDGHVFTDRIFHKGMAESWTAKEKIELSLGNAWAAELEVNGRRIPVVGRRGQAVKNILINKEGLSIPR